MADVVEDTTITLDDLDNLGLDPIALEAIEAVTRRPAPGEPPPGRRREPYLEFIARAGRNTIGRVVKIADIMDNISRLSKLPNIVEAQSLAVRYRTALAILELDTQAGMKEGV